MRTKPSHALIPADQPEITRLDRARFVKEAKRLRADGFDRLFAALGRSFARFGQALAAPIARRSITQQRPI